MTVDIFNGYMERWARDNIATGMPGIVVDTSEYKDTCCISVRPAISRVHTNGLVIDNSEYTIHDVLLIWPGGGGALLSCPIQVGEPVWLQFSQRNLEDWVYSDGTQEITPGDSRHFAMTDAVAFPRMPTSRNHLSPSLDNAEFKFNNHLISLRPSDELLITNGGAQVILNPDGTITANGATITTDGNVITANGTNLDQFYADYLTHTHKLTLLPNRQLWT
jgi:Phage protein Gp138 N-terminal domain